jgi:hypothetical protein
VTPQPSTSLRVRFFESQGWKYKDTYIPLGGDRYNKAWFAPNGRRCELPEIDANTVRDAWNGLSHAEKRRFMELLLERLNVSPLAHGVIIEVLIEAFDQIPTTLAEIYCEVKGVK